MGLYKILLVDDEEEVRTSIISNVPWAELGFEVIGDAENGEDALVKIGVLQPDLVLTDIKMPYMDGLELAGRIRSDGSSMEIVIFSGFDEFEYAKQAIRLNVLEYILKPVNVEELKEILLRVKQKMDKKIQEKRDVDKLRENYIRSLPILKEHFLADLINGRLSQEEILEGSRRYQLAFGNAPCFAGAVIQIEQLSGGEEVFSFHQETELLPLSVKNILKEHLNRGFLYETMETMNGIHLIFGLETSAELGELMERLRLTGLECRKILELEIVIGIGKCYKDLGEIPYSFTEARDAIGYRSIVQGTPVIYIGDMEGGQGELLQFDHQLESELIGAVKFGEETAIREAINQAIRRMEEAKVHDSIQQIYILSIFNSLLQIMQGYSLTASDIWGTENQDYFGVLGRMNRTSNIQNFLVNTCISIHEKISRERTDSVQNIVRKATAYLQENYTNPELSVEMVCEHLHLSATYFSAVFKKEMGQSYVNYLTELRMKRAAELLKSTEDKTYVIAASVGYLEPNYFSYVFKKTFGISPSKYRGN